MNCDIGYGLKFCLRLIQGESIILYIFQISFIIINYLLYFIDNNEILFYKFNNIIIRI